MKSFSIHNKSLLIQLFIIVSFGLLISSCNKTQSKPAIIGIEELINHYNGNANLYVVNFWATWCKPCIEELPYFEKMRKKYENKGVEFLLVSLDFVEDYDNKLIPFLNQNPQKIPIVLLDAGKPKYWIDKINTTWGGAIPATLIQSSKLNEPFFKEGELSLAELDNAIQSRLKQLN